MSVHTACAISDGQCSNRMIDEMLKDDGVVRRLLLVPAKLYHALKCWEETWLERQLVHASTLVTVAESKMKYRHDAATFNQIAGSLISSLSAFGGLSHHHARVHPKSFSRLTFAKHMYST